ncbi:MAG: S9 family peptidase [Bacteroidota bacterium]
MHSIKYLVLVFAVSFSTSSLIAQKDITVENIWQNYTYVSRSVPGFNFMKDGKHYTRLENNQIVQYDLTTGQQTAVLLDPSQITDNTDFGGRISSYQFNEDESQIILKTASENIYRHSSKAFFFVYDRQAKKLTTVSTKGKHSYASLNAQSDKIAFAMNNDLYIKDLKSGKTTQITTDGKENHIINGSADWVYEEEFTMAKAFEWSPDGKYLAFMRFDESKVSEFTMTMYHDDTYPQYETFKYPKVGEVNSVMSVHIYNIETDKTIKADIGSETDIYIPRIRWTHNPASLCIFRMNRHQNELELLLADAKSGKTSLMMKETNKYYIGESHFDNLTFLKDGKSFVYTSEQDGYTHIYLYGMDGKLKQQITKGNFDVTSFYGVDEANGKVFYQAAENSPLERQVYVIDLKGKNKKLLTPAKGSNSAQFSGNFDYFVNTFSTVNSASTYTVLNRSGKAIRVIEDNADVAKLQEEYGVQKVEFFNFTTGDDVTLNGWMVKPPNFNENVQYPVFMYVYGGPGSQTVMDAFGGFNYWWYQMLAQKGYIVVSVDNRGTGGRGEEFKKMTYLQLGKYETIDQIEAAKYLADLPYTDADRIGIFGWSYGGYMSSLCLSKGNDVFKAGIAVAPVTNWKWYDTIYTERYMRTIKENPEGYRDNSPVYFADRIKGPYLLVHGVADDNVHFQNTAEMTNALIKANKQFDTYIYPNRNHGIYGGTTRLHLYNKMTNFILQNL